MNISGIIILFPVLLLIIGIPVAIGIYVYRDASRRNMNAALWTLLAVFAPGFIGLIIYLLVRSGYSDSYCPTCGGAVRESFAVCPHCGASLKAHCTNCNSPLEAGWINCPHCGMPIPAEQQEQLASGTKKDKGLGRLLFFLIVVPILLCILMILAAAMYSFKSVTYSSLSAALSAGSAIAGHIAH